MTVAASPWNISEWLGVAVGTEELGIELGREELGLLLGK